MAGIKQINNVVPSVERPMRLSDLQNVWDALNQIFAGDSVRIISGLDYTSDISGRLSAGVLSYRNQLYYFDGAAEIMPNTVIYGVKVAGGSRTFANGVSYPFDFNYILTDDPASEGVSTGEAVVVLPANRNNQTFLDAHRLGFTADNSITTAKIANGAVTTAKIAEGAVGRNQLATQFANYYVMDGLSINVTGTTVSLTLQQFMFGGTPASRGINVITLTKNVAGQEGQMLDINILPEGEDEMLRYPDTLTLFVVPPSLWDVKVNVQLAGNPQPIYVNYSQNFPQMLSGTMALNRIIVIHLRKATPETYVVVNAYQSSDFQAEI